MTYTLWVIIYDSLPKRLERTGRKNEMLDRSGKSGKNEIGKLEPFELRSPLSNLNGNFPISDFPT